MPQMITVDRVAKDYRTRTGPKRVLEDVSFTLDMGERSGRAGAQRGRAKSTLIRLVSGGPNARPPAPSPARCRYPWPLAFGRRVSGAS